MERNSILERKKHKSSLISSDLKTEYSGISYLMFKKDFKLKISIIMSTVVFIVTVLIAIIYSIFYKDKRILTFDYNTKSENVFTINLIMFYIFLCFISLINFHLIYSLYKEKDRMFIKIMNLDLNWYFFVTQILIAIPFLIGVIFKKDSISLIYSISFNILAILLMCFYYTTVKAKKNLSFASFIDIYIYTSLIFGFSIYITFYNLSEIIANNFNANSTITNIVSIGSYSIYAIITIVVITYYKDVIFSLIINYFIVSNMIEDPVRDNQIIISTIVILSFNTIAVLFTLIKYKKSTFGYEDDSNLNEIINSRARHKKSSWFFNGEN